MWALALLPPLTHTLPDNLEQSHRHPCPSRGQHLHYLEEVDIVNVALKQKVIDGF